MNMPPMKQITIIDGQAGKAIMLMPDMKIAIAMDMKKMSEDMKKSAKWPRTLRPICSRWCGGLSARGAAARARRSRSSARRRSTDARRSAFGPMPTWLDMTLWADPETARPIRIEIGDGDAADVRMVMNNFRYDVDLDPSLFSLEPPAGYSTQAMNMTMPVEEDLLRTLRTVAEHNKGVFPAKLGMNKEVMKALMPAGSRSNLRWTSRDGC